MFEMLFEQLQSKILCNLNTIALTSVIFQIENVILYIFVM